MDEQSSPVRQILVGVDGSTHSLRAVRWCGRLARALQAQVVLLYVVPLPGSAFALGLAAGPIPTHGPGSREIQRHVDDILARAIEELSLPEEQCQRLSEIGNPAQAIAAAAQRLGADLIVVGHRGMGALGELFIGSTSHQVLHTATRPVLIV